MSNAFSTILLSQTKQSCCLLIRRQLSGLDQIIAIQLIRPSCEVANTKKGVPKDPILLLISWEDQPRAVIVAVETVTKVMLVTPAPAASLEPVTLLRNRVPVATPDSALLKVMVPEVPVLHQGHH